MTRSFHTTVPTHLSKLSMDSASRSAGCRQATHHCLWGFVTGGHGRAPGAPPQQPRSPRCTLVHPPPLTSSSCRKFGTSVHPAPGGESMCSKATSVDLLPPFPLLFGLQHGIFRTFFNKYDLTGFRTIFQKNLGEMGVNWGGPNNHQTHKLRTDLLPENHHTKGPPPPPPRQTTEIFFLHQIYLWTCETSGEFTILAKSNSGKRVYI